MKFDEFIANCKPTLVGIHLLSEMFGGRFSLDMPLPHTTLSEDELALLQERLNHCMPLDSMIIDLWDWDIHFEDDLGYDWYFGAVFDADHSSEYYAETLADYFLQKVDEFDIDYNQTQSPDEFESWVRNNAETFVKTWRERIGASTAEDQGRAVSEQVPQSNHNHV